MLPADFDRIDASHVENLVAAAVPEDRQLEYKQALSIDKDADKKEFLADVSSFANTLGGDFVFGIEEARDENGKPTGIPSSVLGIRSSKLTASGSTQSSMPASHRRLSFAQNSSSARPAPCW